MDTEEKYICDRCGVQLTTIDEISIRICDSCLKKAEKGISRRGIFLCKICGQRLLEMKEIAQGICQHCKASIIRKLK